MGNLCVVLSVSYLTVSHWHFSNMDAEEVVMIILMVLKNKIKKKYWVHLLLEEWQGKGMFALLFLEENININFQICENVY